jgi:hypothetical protein
MENQNFSRTDATFIIASWLVPAAFNHARHWLLPQKPTIHVQAVIIAVSPDNKRLLV